jgi:anthranilate synthase component 1
MVTPDYSEFARLARDFTLVPVVKSVSADLLTPVSAFLAIAEREPDSILLESVERGEHIGRYTFLGARPYMKVEGRGPEISIRRGRSEQRRRANVFSVLKELLREHRSAIIPGLPPFTGGAVGYFSYDVVRQLENIGEHAKDDLKVPDCALMFFDKARKRPTSARSPTSRTWRKNWPPVCAPVTGNSARQKLWAS